MRCMRCWIAAVDPHRRGDRAYLVVVLIPHLDDHVAGVAPGKPVRADLGRRECRSAHGGVHAVELGALVIAHALRSIDDIEIVAGHCGLLSAARDRDLASQRLYAARVASISLGRTRCGETATGARDGASRNSHAQNPLASVHLRVAMATPTTPTGMHAADEEHVRVLDESLRTGVHSVSEKVIPLVEETASIGKRQGVTGRVRVQTVTDTIEELARADVQRESVEVTRVPIDR